MKNLTNLKTADDKIRKISMTNNLTLYKRKQKTWMARERNSTKKENRISNRRNELFDSNATVATMALPAKIQVTNRNTTGQIKAMKTVTHDEGYESKTTHRGPWGRARKYSIIIVIIYHLLSNLLLLM